MYPNKEEDREWTTSSIKWSGYMSKAYDRVD
jgi:hypothetical protein